MPRMLLLPLPLGEGWGEGAGQSSLIRPSGTFSQGEKDYFVSLNSSRPISMRRISLVPAPIS
jgi:hypothetical protein